MTKIFWWKYFVSKVHSKKKTVTEGEVVAYDVPQLEHRPRIVFFRKEKNANDMKQQEKINSC